MGVTHADYEQARVPKRTGSLACFLIVMAQRKNPVLLALPHIVIYILFNVTGHVECVVVLYRR